MSHKMRKMHDLLGIRLRASALKLLPVSYGGSSNT